jgi:hypothetical protein
MADKETKGSNYNKTCREPLFRVEINTADSIEAADNMRQMKVDIIDKSGTAKKGVIDMYKFAKEKVFFDK